MIPSKIKDTDENITALMQNRYEKAIQEENKLDVNDRVRYIINFKQFEKHTLPKWSKTVHKIVSCNSHSYVLDNGKIKKYYELQLVDSVQNLNIPENKTTREFLRKQNTIKRKLKRENIDLTNILTQKREIKKVDKLRY